MAQTAFADPNEIRTIARRIRSSLNKQNDPAGIADTLAYLLELQTNYVEQTAAQIVNLLGQSKGTLDEAALTAKKAWSGVIRLKSEVDAINAAAAGHAQLDQNAVQQAAAVAAQVASARAPGGPAPAAAAATDPAAAAAAAAAMSAAAPAAAAASDDKVLPAQYPGAPIMTESQAADWVMGGIK